MHSAIKFGVSTWLWTSPFNTASIQLFGKIKKMGYDAVEIPVEDTALIDTHKLNEALKKHELLPVVCGAFNASRDLTHDDPSFNKIGIDYITDCLKICKTIGTDFFAGPMYAAVGKARLVPPEQRKTEWDRAVVNLRKVCHIAEDMGLQIAIEPLNRFESDLINTTEDVLKLISEIDRPSAKILLDGFHMNIEEPDMEKAVLLAGKKLIHVQVSENNRGTPGTGQTRWDALLRGLRAIQYKGIITIESFTPDVKTLAGAVCIWRPLAESQDNFAENGLQFLQQWIKDY